MLYVIFFLYRQDRKNQLEINDKTNNRRDTNDLLIALQVDKI